MTIDVATVRKVARLARIAQPEETLEKLAGELNGHHELDLPGERDVDTDGVGPMTSAVHMPGRPCCEDVVTEGGDPELVPFQRAEARRRVLRRAQGGRIECPRSRP